MSQMQRQQERLLDAYVGGVLELAEFQRKRYEISQRQQSLLSQERHLATATQQHLDTAAVARGIEEFCTQVRRGLANATFEQRRVLVELLIDRVLVTDEDVEVRYVVPTSPNPPHQPFCQLRTDYLDALPGRQVMGKHPPGDAATEHVGYGVYYLSYVNRARAASWLFWRQQGFQDRPFGICEVCGIAPPFHVHHLQNAYNSLLAPSPLLRHPLNENERISWGLGYTTCCRCKPDPGLAVI
jgi:hypothetical protein